MDKQQTQTNSDLLKGVRLLCNKAKQAGFIEDSVISTIEDFTYGNIVKNLLRTLLDEDNSKELKEVFGINKDDISKIRLSPSLVAFTTDENPKGNSQDYKKFKEMMTLRISSKIIDFIQYFEDYALLNECEKEIAELKKHVLTEEDLVDNAQGSIQVGFSSGGSFTSLNDSKFNYFNKYSDEQLDEIYETSPYNRNVIDKVREFRKRNRL